MWKIIKEELKELTNTKWKILGIVFLLITPMLYAILFLSAFSKPIHKFDNADIRVTSLDIDKKTNKPNEISSTIAKGMVGTHDIDVHIDKYKMTVKESTEIYKNETEAKAAVDNGKVDGIFIIPDNFFNDMTNAIKNIIKEIKHTKADPKYKPKITTLPRITFYTSYKNNYVAARFLSMRADVTSLKLEFLDNILDKTIDGLIKVGIPVPATIRADINNLYQTSRNKFIKYKAIGKDIGDYGNGLAPYFFSIALWAGCIMSVFMYKNRRIGPEAKKAVTFKNYFSKTIVWVSTAWIQAILMISGAFMVGLKIEANPFHLFIFAMFVATLFALIVQAISSIFRVGEVGSFMVLILLILQLAVSGGVFPATMQEPFWQKIAPIAPFTYTIDSFREFLASPNSTVIWTGIWPVLLFLLFIPLSLTINFIADKKRFKKYGHYTSHDPELHNEM
ncbi:YhgE/Pip domain-containing protein [Mycoplasma marinum]|uniref:ABC-2 type transporter transmembrane domain-containing protein n=1 Tax=Mycoplasma marinum TaxID=1937190 RepID=A0A4R0XJP0_9MOLU|nr:YhgE/Pip family protein [Mycoplasma marinum]TCG10654.1 hypothetical protein C4B24_04280 [Mycoplasma marinum]